VQAKKIRHLPLRVTDAATHEASSLKKDRLLFIALGGNVIDSSTVLDVKRASHDGHLSYRTIKCKLNRPDPKFFGKDYWLKVSKQKKAKRQGVDAPAFPSSPSDGHADNSKVPVCPY